MIRKLLAARCWRFWTPDSGLVGGVIFGLILGSVAALITEAIERAL